MNNYFILRHGDTTHHLKNKGMTYFKWLDTNPPVKLTKKGVNRIKIVANKLKKEKINLIYSSDIFRACQTAKIVSKILGIKVIFDKRLREINLGVYHGRPKKELYNDFPRIIERFKKRPLKGESWNDVRKRLKSFLKDIEKKHKNKKILIVSHGDPLWLFEGIIKKMTNKELLDEIFQDKKYIKMGELRKLKWN